MWKFKTIIKMEPRVRTRESLPNPPRGMDWEQNEETKAWRLVPVSKKPPRPPLAPGAGASTTNSTTASGTGDTTASGGAAPKEVFVTGIQHLQEEKLDDDEWDLLSEQISIGGGAVVVGANGSIRSLTSSLENNSASMSIPFKIHRTLSSSTIDSADATSLSLGGGLGCKGVDYVEHIVLPNDTLQGICLAYKISATRLRQVNQFSGNSLSLAPKKLIVPISASCRRKSSSAALKVQDHESREYKIHAFLAEMPNLQVTEAQAYLEMSDWIIEDAVRSAKEDVDWHKSDMSPSALRGIKDISITVKVDKGGVPVDLQTTGADLAQPQASQLKPVSYNGLPAIATKNVRPQDVYNAAPQHQGFGVELKSLDSSSSPSKS